MSAAGGCCASAEADADADAVVLAAAIKLELENRNAALRKKKIETQATGERDVAAIRESVSRESEEKVNKYSLDSGSRNSRGSGSTSTLICINLLIQAQSATPTHPHSRIHLKAIKGPTFCGICN